MIDSADHQAEIAIEKSVSNRSRWQLSIRTLFVATVVAALAVFLVLNIDTPTNSFLYVPECPKVSFELYRKGTGLGRYSTQGRSSALYDCVFKEEVVCIHPKTHLSKKEVLDLVAFVSAEFASRKNIDLDLDLLLDPTVVDSEVLSEISRIKNLTCLNLSATTLSKQEVEIVLSMKNLQYLCVLRRNFTDDSLIKLLSESKAKVVVADD